MAVVRETARRTSQPIRSRRPWQTRTRGRVLLQYPHIHRYISSRHRRARGRIFHAANLSPGPRADWRPHAGSRRVRRASSGP